MRRPLIISVDSSPITGAVLALCVLMCISLYLDVLEPLPHACFMKTKSTDATHGNMTVSEAGRLGGLKIKQTYGEHAGYYASIGRKGGEATKKKHGLKFYADIGKLGGVKGGVTTKERHGAEYYERIGIVGGERSRKRASTKNEHSSIA